MKHRGLIMFAAGLTAALAVGWFFFPFALYKTIEQPLQFSHKIHTGETAGLPCEECHTVTADGRFTGIPTVEKCAGCHSQTLGNSPDEKRLVDEYVTPKREIPWLVYSRQPDNVYFSHAQHVKLGGLTCDKCHRDHGSSESLRPYQENRITGYSRDIWGQNISGIHAKPGGGMKMDDCSDCHKSNHVAESCIDCHK